MPPKARKIYLFDLEGVELGTFPGASECAEQTGATRQAVTAAATRGSVLMSRYYVAHSPSFVPPRRQITRNPLRAAATRRDRCPTTVPTRLNAVTPGEHELAMELTSGYLLGH